MFRATLATRAEKREQSRCPSMGERINQLYSWDWVISSRKRNKGPQGWTLTTLCQEKEARQKRPHTAWLHSHEISRTGESTVRNKVSRCQGLWVSANGGWLRNGRRVPFWINAHFLELESSRDDCTPLRMCWTPLNCALWWILYVFYHKFKPPVTLWNCPREQSDNL